MLQWLQKRQKKVLLYELTRTKLVVLEVCSSCQKLRRQICRPGPGALLQAAPGCMCLQHRGSLSARAAHCSHCRLQSRSTTPALLPLLCSNHDHKLNSCSCSLYVGAYCIWWMEDGFDITKLSTKERIWQLLDWLLTCAVLIVAHVWDWRHCS